MFLYSLFTAFNKTREISVSIGENVSLSWQIHEQCLNGNVELYKDNYNESISRWQLSETGQCT